MRFHGNIPIIDDFVLSLRVMSYQVGKIAANAIRVFMLVSRLCIIP